MHGSSKFSLLLVAAALTLCAHCHCFIALGVIIGVAVVLRIDSTSPLMQIAGLCSIRIRHSAWALAFPLNLLAYAAVLYDSELNSKASHFLVALFLGAGTFATATLLLNTATALLNGGVFVPIAKWGPISVFSVSMCMCSSSSTALHQPLACCSSSRTQAC